MVPFFHDIRLALRGLSAARATTLAAVLVLALGTGINTAVFAVAYGILLRPLPYADSARIAVIGLRGSDGTDFGVPAAEFDEWRRRLRTVEKLAAYSTGEFTVRGIGEPRVLRVALVRGDFFGVLGTPPLAGRHASADAGGWMTVTARAAARLVDDGRAVGRSATVGRGQYIINAVVPDAFAFPSEEVDAWLPSSTETALAFGSRADARSFRLIGRLTRGVTVAQAAEDASRVLRDLRPASPADRGAARHQARAVLLSLEETLTGRVRPVLSALSVAALLVLLVACGNVASLLVGRAVARSHDVAVRIALGATRWQLVRGILAESLVVALAAAAAGVWVGYALVRLFVGMAAGVFPRLDGVALDLPVLAASALVAFVVAVLCGAAPALHALRTGFASAFRAAATSSRPARRLRAVLAAGQIALSIVLLAGAGLVARTVLQLLDQAGGIQPDNVTSMRLVMTDTTTFSAASRTMFVRQAVERVRRLPGVQAVGAGSALPPRVAPLTMGIRVVSNGRDDFQALTLISVTPGYLAALGARVVRGRGFSEADLDGREAVAMLSESAARHLSPSRDPVGRPLVFPLPPGLGGRGNRPTVVAIVGDIKYTGLDAPSAGAVYLLWPDLPAGVAHLIVRGGGSPAALAGALHRTVRELDPTLPVTDVRSLDDEILSSIADRRVRLVPALAFAALALAVALVGLAASMTRSVAERRRELAIRGALGASPGRTLRMVVGEGAVVTAVGILFGLGFAALLASTLSSLLYGVTPHDPATYAAVAVLVAAASLGVCYLAARRALRIDVLELLRSE